MKSAFWEVREIVKVVVVCLNCGVEVDLIITSRQHTVVFHCINKKCSKWYFSVCDGSVFEGSKLSIQQIFVIINFNIVNICEYSQIRYQAQLSEERLSYETLADWVSYCREICLDIVARESPKLIGGQGYTVEIDKSKFGRRKYKKGRYVEGQWVWEAFVAKLEIFFWRLVVITNETRQRSSTSLSGTWRRSGDRLLACIWQARSRRLDAPDIQPRIHLCWYVCIKCNVNECIVYRRSV